MSRIDFDNNFGAISLTHCFHVFLSVSESDELQLLSCGADKSIIFRTAQQVLRQCDKNSDMYV